MRRAIALAGLFACAPRDPDPDVMRNEAPYGPCFDAQGFTVCREDEPLCDAYPDIALAELTVCAADCEQASDCPAPESGDAQPACSGDPPGCVLECAGGESCPDDMECAATGSCMWRS
jgi:hypothetical protein